MEEDTFVEWYELEKDKNRNYLHFDGKIKIQNKDNIELIKQLINPKSIIEHSFYPFINFTLKNLRHIKKIINGNIKRKKNIKKRKICYCSHKDALIYSRYGHLLLLNYEIILEGKGLTKNVIAYRSINKKCNIDFAKEVFDFIKNKGECVALSYDISKFFDNLDHKNLKNVWNITLGTERLPFDHYKIYNAITNFSYINRDTVIKEFNITKSKIKQIINYGIASHSELRKKNDFCKKNNIELIKENPKNICGIPQGSPISGILSNMYMINFDEAIKKIIDQVGGLYRRYCDDIIIIINNKDHKYINDTVLSLIKKIKLEIQEEKIDIVCFKKNNNGDLYGCNIDNDKINKNLQYLGFEFNGKASYIRSSTLSRYYRNMKKRIKFTIGVAYGKKSKGYKIFKRKLLFKYTFHNTKLSKFYNKSNTKNTTNTVTYRKNSKEKFNEKTIHNQMKNHDKKLKKIIKQESQKRYIFLKNRKEDYLISKGIEKPLE